MMDDNNKKKFALHQQLSSNMNQMQENRINDTTSRENLANLLQNLESFRRVQELSLQSVSEESFASSSSEKTLTMESSSLQRRTTGGNETQTDEDKNSSSISSSMMMKMSACPLGKTMFSQQQQKQQSNVASSSTSSITSSIEAMRKTKTLSFLHNEDLFETGTTMITGGKNSSNSLHNDDKSLPTASHLFRSISFQEQRRQYNQKSTLQRTESGKESGDLSSTRKMAILSPKHSLQELNERIKQQQMRMQQQMFYGSSELSM